MKSRNVLIGLLVGMMWMSAVAAPNLQVGPKQLLEGGDCQADEVLAWERLRAERQVAVALDDSAPIVCRDGQAGRIYLATGTGQFSVSIDEGRLFSSPREIIVSRRAVREVQALGVLADGQLMLVYAEGGRLGVASSWDRGLSWSPVGEVAAAGYDRLEADGVRLLPLADGTVLLAVVAWKAAGTGDPEGLVLSSNDAGKTWSKRGSLGPRCAGANLLPLRSGELLAAISYRGSRQPGDPELATPRAELFRQIVVARSGDGGKSWGDYQVVTRYREAPGDLCELADGTVVLTYGQQNFPYGARAMVSRDGGRTWGRQVYILGFSTVQLDWASGPMLTQPGWRVTSVAAKDNTLLTLYTRGGYVYGGGLALPKRESIPAGERGRATMSLRWALEGLAKPPLGAPAGVSVIAKPNAEGYLDNGRCLIKPEHLQWGGDYYSSDEILRYERLPAERHVVGPGAPAVVSFDPQGNVIVGGEKIYRSADQGRSWELLGEIPNAAGVRRRKVQAFGVLRDGTMVAGCTGTGLTEILRSEDNGRNWSEHGFVDPGAFHGMSGGGGMGIIQLADGTALMTCGNLELKGGVTADFDLPWDGIYRSRDGGKSWGDFSFLSHPACESNLLKLQSGRMLAAIRFQGTRMTDDFLSLDPQGYRTTLVKNTAVAFSEDNGYTWSPPRTVSRYNECPASLVEMAEGTIVLTFCQKNNPNGARAMVSRDQGKTWEPRQYMVNWWEASGVFPNSIVLPDGRILTAGAGYSSVAVDHVLEVKIWKPLGPENASD